MFQEYEVSNTKACDYLIGRCTTAGCNAPIRIFNVENDQWEDSPPMALTVDQYRWDHVRPEWQKKRPESCKCNSLKEHLQLELIGFDPIEDSRWIVAEECGSISRMIRQISYSNDVTDAQILLIRRLFELESPHLVLISAERLYLDDSKVWTFGALWDHGE